MLCEADLSIVKCFAGLFEAYKHIMRIGGTGDKPRFFVRKVLFIIHCIVSPTREANY